MRAIAITQTEACTRHPRKQQRPETTQITTHISEKREEQNISMGVDSLPLKKGGIFSVPVQRRGRESPRDRLSDREIAQSYDVIDKKRV